MVNKELLDYIAQVKEKGHTDSDIKEHLVKHGYPHDMIEEAFLFIDSAEPEAAPAVKQKIEQRTIMPAKKKDKPKSNVLLFAMVIIFILVVAGSAALYFTVFRYSGCDEVSMAVHTLDNYEVLCIFPDNSKMMMILKNTGQTTIKDVEVKANDKKLGMLENANINPGEIFTYTMDYGLSDTLEKVSFIPYTDKKSCPAVHYENIRNC